MAISDLALASPTDVGRLGIFQLKRLWSRVMVTRQGRTPNSAPEGNLDSLVLSASGLGLEQTLQYLFRAGPSFEEFESWIVATAGAPDAAQIARINAAIAGQPPPQATQQWLNAVDASDPVLSPEDLAFWEREGYVIVRGAVTESERAAAEQVVWETTGADPANPESWYFENPHGIMVQRFQAPALTAIRRSPRIHKAFAQLWGTADLWPTTDRIGFNAPERPGHPFRGTPLHWDVSLHPPVPFGTQGILYLTDTAANQGAFTCVPGFQHRLEPWLKSLPPGADPRRQDFAALGAVPIAAGGGDLIIWHQALPHGASPNRAARPRLVHYITFLPAGLPEPTEWR